MIEKDDTTSPSAPQGVMTAGYAQERTINPSLRFRLQARAHETILAHDRFATRRRPELHLDYGAADGLSTKLLHLGLKATRSIGIEYSADIARFSEQADLPDSCEIQIGDVAKELLRVESSSIDVITALAFLEHVADASELFRESRRILRPGGLFIATCPDPSWDKVSGSLGLHKDEHHEQDYEESVFRSFAEEAYLTPVCYHRFMNVFTGFLPYLRLPMSPSFGAFLDAFLRPIPLSRFTFVNQLFVARKP
jgi:SAM-dependent methyltransferase